MGCGGPNLKIVFVVGVRVIIFENLCWGWGYHFWKNSVGVGIVNIGEIGCSFQEKSCCSCGCGVQCPKFVVVVGVLITSL